MSILTANLKHLYQRRALIFWYLILLCQFPLVLPPRPSFTRGVPPIYGRFVFYLVVSCFLGFLIGYLQREVLSRPFTFCLPGHRTMPRKVVVTLGVLTNVAFGVMFLWYPGLTLSGMLLASASAACTGMLCYLFGTAVALWKRSNTGFIGFLPLFVMMIVYSDLHRPLEIMIVFHPIKMIMLSVAVCVCIYSWLGRDDRARTHCGTFTLSPGDHWNQDRARRFRQERAAARWARKDAQPASGPNRLEQVFVPQVTRPMCFSTRRNFWAETYATLDRWFSYGLWPALLGFLFIFLFFGYFGTIGGQRVSVPNLIFIVPLFWAAFWQYPLCGNLLLPIARRHRFAGAITNVIGLVVLAMIGGFVLVGLSTVLQHILPTLRIKGLDFMYRAIDMGLVFLCPLLMPVGFTIAVLLRRGRVLVFIFLGMVFPLSIPFDWMHWLIARPWLVALLMAVAWIILIAVLRWHWHKRDVVGPLRT